MTLRPYQRDAHDAAWQHMRTSVEPCLIEAATGAGKSHIIAAIAQTVHQATNKKVAVPCAIGGVGATEPRKISGKRSQSQHV
jgi:DNA or RNA helicases of superfamily II